MIAQWQIEQFHQQGFLVVEEVLSAEDRAAAGRFRRLGRREPQHSEVWGETLDGRPRFDLESDHAPHHPSLRRVSSPRRFPPPTATPRLIRGWRRLPAS
jgi:hypothetical protein